MVVAYINNTCMELPDIQRFFEDQSEYLPEDLWPIEVVDADTISETVLPIPENSDFRLSRFNNFNRILALDFKNFRTMTYALDRVEILSTDKKVISDKELENYLKKRGVNCKTENERCGLGDAHMIDITDLVDFYNKAFLEEIDLTPEESTLFYQLFNLGVIKGNPGEYSTGEVVSLIAFSRSPEIPDRSFLLTHELSHALYMLDPEYRKNIDKIWNDYPDFLAKPIMSTFLATTIYTEEVVATEAAAYSLGDDWNSSWGNVYRMAAGACAANVAQKSFCREIPSLESFEETTKHMAKDFRKASNGKVPGFCGR